MFFAYHYLYIIYMHVINTDCKVSLTYVPRNYMKGVCILWFSRHIGLKLTVATQQQHPAHTCMYGSRVYLKMPVTFGPSDFRA